METPALDLGPGRFRVIQRAVCDVARGLSRQHGQRQFYTLAQVRESAAGVDAQWQPWIFAVFTARADFDAWFAVRDTPGSYEQLRAALAAPDTAPDTTHLPAWTPADDGRWDGDSVELWRLVVDALI